MGYINAAVAWLRCHTQNPIPIYSNEGGSRQDGKLHPQLSSLLADRRKWTQKKPLRLPLTNAMLTHMYTTVVRHADMQSGDRPAALYDWIGLGLFTGHRLGEFGQTVLPTGSKASDYDPLPHNHHIPKEWRGKPKAFVREDFTFFDSNYLTLDHRTIHHTVSSVEFVHIRWRYDKSKFNFIVKKYRRQHGTPLCPVKRATSIIVRAMALHLPPRDSPIGIFTGANGQIYTIRGHHVQSFMQEACIQAYPDPRHHLRSQLHLFQAHSIRITACVALDNARVPHEDIAFRLRWNSDAIKGYLRDCGRHIHDLTSLTVAGISADADTTTLHPAR